MQKPTEIKEFKFRTDLRLRPVNIIEEVPVKPIKKKKILKMRRPIENFTENPSDEGKSLRQRFDTLFECHNFKS